MSQLLRNLNLAAGVVQVLQGGILYGLVAEYGRQEWPVQSLGWKSEVLSTDEYQLGWLVPTFSLLSAANHLYGAAVGYDSIISSKRNLVRWIEYAVTASIMLWIIGTLSGITDYRTLTGLVLANVALQLIGYQLECAVADGASQTQINTLQAVGFTLHLAIWTPILIQFITITEDEEETPDAIKSIVWTLFAFFTSFGILSALYTSGVIDYVQYETGFVVLSFTSKTFLAWMVYGGVLAADARFPEPTAVQ